MKKGKVICVYSPKGGVGKSVISSNLAAVSYLMGKKTLLIDADVYDGGLSLFINENINKTLYTLVKDIKNDKYSSIKDYVYNYNESLDILCSSKVQLEASLINPKYLDKILCDARNNYDLIIVDTYSSYNDFNEVIFNLCDRLLLILTNDLVNIKNMRNIITIFKDMNYNKYKVIYNTSFDFRDSYFSHYDMIDMVGTNIDYSIGREGFYKNITSYIYNNTIPLLYKDNDINYYKVVDKFTLIIKDVM